MSDVPPYRILLLEDRADDAALLTRELRRSGIAATVSHTDNAAAFLAALEPLPDLILADYQLPGYDALAALRALRQLGAHTPVIVVSGTVGEEAAVECLREGAVDYLLKDRLGRLGQAVRNALDRARLDAERERTLEALRQSEERYRSLIEEAPNPIWVIDAKTVRFLEVNRAAVNHYEYSRDEFLEMTLLDVGSPDESASTLEGMHALTTGVENVGLRHHRTKSGRPLEVSIASRPVTFAGRLAIMAIIDDVTERNHLEELLRQSQKMEAVGQLAGGIAHDFNNLLTAVMGYSGLLISRAGERRDLVEPAHQIRAAAERAAALTRQLLTFSRRQPLEPRVLDLNEVIADFESMLRRLLGEQISVQVQLHGGICPVLADRSQIEQVILNLAVNALDAMPHGGQLTIATSLAEPAAGTDAGAQVALVVTDTGAGMDAETRARIFEPFFTTKELGRGTGLGLATVYGIVHQGGGHIEVTSQPGEGASFRVFLPRAGGKPEARIARTEVAAHGGPETILVIEDDALIRQLVHTVLEHEGYSVLAADSSAAALQLLEGRSGPLDLVLSDVVMPNMSGPEVVAAVKALKPATRVLFMSGYAAVNGRCDLLPEGAHVLPKPFTLEALRQKVRQALENGEGS